LTVSETKNDRERIKEKSLLTMQYYDDLKTTSPSRKLAILFASLFFTIMSICRRRLGNLRRRLLTLILFMIHSLFMSFCSFSILSLFTHYGKGTKTISNLYMMSTKARQQGAQIYMSQEERTELLY
jgi:predicted PurR-regulated permease PerM